MVSFKSYDTLKVSLNKQIKIRGRISSIPWQHTIASIQQYPFIEYFDLEDGFQTIIYSKEKINSQNILEITGKVIEVKGRSKRPTNEEHDEYTEYHIIVQRFEEL